MGLLLQMLDGYLGIVKLFVIFLNNYLRIISVNYHWVIVNEKKVLWFLFNC